MGGRMSRAKGASAEREVAKLLETWWGQHEPGCKFQRTPGSGGWSSPSVRADFKTSGDLVTTAKTFPWCVEVKRREGWSEKQFLARRSSPVWNWWIQSCRAASEADLFPMLWFRKSQMQWCILMQSIFIGIANSLGTETNELQEFSWCGQCQGILLGGDHFPARACGTCHGVTQGVTLILAKQFLKAKPELFQCKWTPETRVSGETKK